MNEDYPEDFELEDQRDAMLKKFCKTVRVVCEDLQSKTIHIDVAVDELLTLVDEIETLYEQDDPRSMGWVGDDGLP